MGGASDTLWILIAVAGAGCALAARGWRGRRVGDHPFCRGCEFDLFGQPAGSTACPECGRNLSLPNSTSVGMWHPRRGPGTVGLMLLAAAVASLGMIGGREMKRDRTLGSRGRSWAQRIS
jgi:hypothetical protein